MRKFLIAASVALFSTGLAAGFTAANAANDVGQSDSSRDHSDAETALEFMIRDQNRGPRNLENLPTGSIPTIESYPSNDSQPALGPLNNELGVRTGN